MMRGCCRTFEALFIKKDASMWLQKFNELDTGGSGRIPINTCIAVAGVDTSQFFEKLFAFMDIEGRGSQDLGGFIFSTWNFCTLDKKGLLSFVYDLCSAEEMRLGTDCELDTPSRSRARCCRCHRDV